MDLAKEWEIPNQGSGCSHTLVDFDNNNNNNNNQFNLINAKHMEGTSLPRKQANYKDMI